MVQDPETRHGYDEGWLRRKYPLTYEYLSRFRSVLESRAAYKKYHAESGNPFYSMFNISAETFAPFKVAWRRMGNDLRATLLDRYTFHPLKEKFVIPSDTVTMVPFQNKDEALYLLAILNSIPLRAAVYSYSPSGRGLGTPAILKDLRIGKYDAGDPLHRSIKTIGEKLTSIYKNERRTRSTMSDAENTLNELACKYWKLTQSELQAFQETVEDRELGASGGASLGKEDDIHSRMFDIGASGEE